MKKLISVLLVVILTASCMTLSVAAEAENAKISPAVRALIAENAGGGMVVEITYHNENYPTEGLSQEEAVANTLAAQRELREQIKEITYCEPGDQIFYNGTMLIGLPYGSIVAVAALENVDYIDLPHDEGSDLTAEQKLDDKMKIALEKLPADTKVHLNIWLAYTVHAYIGMAEPGDDCTHAEVDEYLRVMRTAKRDYITAKNEEYAEVIKAGAEVENVTYLRYTPTLSLATKLSEVKKIASMREVGGVYFGGVIYTPSDDPHDLEDKFADWMYKKYGVVKSDPFLADNGLGYTGVEYSDYREVYVTDDWALVYAVTNMYEPWEYVGHLCLGNRILSWFTPGACICPYGYCVYNAAEDTFYPIERFVEPVRGNDKDEDGKPISVILEPTISLDDYPGLTEALDICNIGAVIGDADGDGITTILDATAIQRYKADLIGETGLDITAADADDDGDVTVLDATRIQRYKAELCNLDGTAYTKA